MKRMVDVKIENGMVTSIDGASIGGGAEKHLYRHDFSMYREDTTVYMVAISPIAEPFKTYGEARKATNAIPIVTGYSYSDDSNVHIFQYVRSEPPDADYITHTLLSIDPTTKALAYKDTYKWVYLSYKSTINDTVTQIY